LAQPAWHSTSGKGDRTHRGNAVRQQNHPCRVPCSRLPPQFRGMFVRTPPPPRLRAPSPVTTATHLIHGHRHRLAGASCLGNCDHFGAHVHIQHSGIIPTLARDCRPHQHVGVFTTQHREARNHVGPGLRAGCQGPLVQQSRCLVHTIHNDLSMTRGL
jgi:hypothetical protein